MPEIAKCPSCPATARPVVLIGGLCKFHWQNPTEKTERSDAKELQKIANKVKLTLSAWFTEMLKIAPKNCENCGKKIVIPSALPPKTKVCHILPKKTFKSVATHTLNRWFGCWQCHQDFDNATDAERSQMHVAEVCRERMKSIYPDISENEKRLVPGWMVPEEFISLLNKHIENLKR